MTRKPDLFRMPQTRAEAWKETEESIDQAADHAEREIPTWGERARVYLEIFLVLQERGPFVADEVREWATLNGLSEPPSRFAWGSVMLKARRDELIEKIGMTEHHFPNSPGTHTKAVTLWAPR